MKDVAIVILNWNGKAYLEQFLGAVVQFADGARVVVADNASTDDSLNFVRNHFPNVEIVENEKNGGFAKGYNDALKRIKSKFYLLLNSDVEVTENWLAPLYQCMQSDDVSGCQPKVLSYAEKSNFEHAGASGGFIDRNYFPFCRGRILNEVEADLGQYDEKMEIFWATGAAMMIRADVFHEHGGFDEDFFAHMEEIDLCWRIKKCGGKFMVVPDSIVYHVGGGTLPYTSPRKVYLNFRNNLMMLIKNHEGLLFPKLMYRMILDGIAAFRFLVSGEFKNFASVFKAHLYQYANLRTLLRKRKEIREKSTEFNPRGMYNGSIIWSFFVKGAKRFSDLNQRLFK